MFRILSHAESIFEKCDSDYFIHNDATITTIQLCVSCFVCWNLAQNDLHSDSIMMRMLTIVKDFFLSFFCEDRWLLTTILFPLRQFSFPPLTVIRRAPFVGKNEYVCKKQLETRCRIIVV